MRLLATIKGFRDEQGSQVIRNIGSRLRDRRIPWNDEEKVIDIRFESLIGAHGVVSGIGYLQKSK